MSKPLILEMLLNRGASVMIDGHKRLHRWGYGTDGNTLTTSKKEGEELIIGEHTVESITVFGPENDDCDPQTGCYYIFDYALVPKEMQLVTSQGTFYGKVVQVIAGQSDQESQTIMLHNGEEYELDEITLYLKAELSREPDSRSEA
jgi:hypothetical protein